MEETTKNGDNSLTMKGSFTEIIEEESDESIGIVENESMATSLNRNYDKPLVCNFFFFFSFYSIFFFGFRKVQHILYL